MGFNRIASEQLFLADRIKLQASRILAPLDRLSGIRYYSQHYSSARHDAVPGASRIAGPEVEEASERGYVRRAFCRPGILGRSAWPPQP